jgi:hypothetical protein
MRIIADFFFLILFGALLLAWFFAWALMHVASGGIHVLIGLAVVCLVIHLLRGRSVA